MKKFEKRNFSDSDKHGLIGSFIDAASIRNDQNVEIAYSKLDENFSAPAHIHTQSKTVVIILSGGMTFSLDGELVEVLQGEYVVFDQGVVEAVVSVRPNTQNLTLHTPSIVGGDKQTVLA